MTSLRHCSDSAAPFPQASNERILLKPHMKLVFEIRDLKYGIFSFHAVKDLNTQPMCSGRIEGFVTR